MRSMRADASCRDTPTETCLRALLLLNEPLDLAHAEAFLHDLLGERLGIRWADVEAQGRLVHRLNELRIECLASMSSGRRSKVLGVSRDPLRPVRMERSPRSVILARVSPRRRPST